jgi:hypothetical protein
MASPSTAIDFGTNRDLTLNILLSFIAQLLDYDIGTGASQDIPSDVVEGFIREGFEKIVMADTGWPYYQTTYEILVMPTNTLSALTSVGTTATATTSGDHGLTTGATITITGCVPTGYNGEFTITVPVDGNGDPIPNQFTYTLGSSQAAVTTLGVVDSNSAVTGTDGRTYNDNFTQILPVTNPVNLDYPFANLAKITNCVNVTDAGNQLIYIDNYRAMQIWPPNSDNDIEGIPAYWSIWGSAINLWPKPDSPYTIQIMGYRRHNILWLSIPTLPIDIDPEFHLPLINYVLARIFQFQEDPEMASIYMNNYEQGVAMVRGWKTAVSRNQQFVLSGGLQTGPYDYYRYMANLSLRAVATGEWS